MTWILIEIEAALVFPIAIGGNDCSGVADHANRARVGVAAQQLP